MTQGELLELMNRCLVKRGDRYYATPAGCIRMQEILAEHGLNVQVTIGADGKFDVQPADNATGSHS